MLKHAKQSLAAMFVIGTEEGLIYRLKKENPHKTFYSLGTAKTCINMKRTTLGDVFEALEQERYVIDLDKDVINKAQGALERMVEYV